MGRIKDQIATLATSWCGSPLKSHRHCLGLCQRLVSHPKLQLDHFLLTSFSLTAVSCKLPSRSLSLRNHKNVAYDEFEGENVCL